MRRPGRAGIPDALASVSLGRYSAGITLCGAPTVYAAALTPEDTTLDGGKPEKLFYSCILSAQNACEKTE